MKLELSEDQLKPVKILLVGFTREAIEAEGSIKLPVQLGIEPAIKRVNMEFAVVKITCVDNIILYWPGLTSIGGLISMGHLCMKFQTSNGIGTVRGESRPHMPHEGRVEARV